MKITLKEIAEIAGVHRSTVDKVIHGRIGVSDEVRQKIQKILDELQYKPNMIGRALQKQSVTFKFAAVLLQVDALEDIRAGIAKAVNHYSNFKIEMSYHVVSFIDAQSQADIIERLTQDDIQGMVISPIHSKVVRDAIDRACERGVMVITTNFDIEDSKRACFVGQNGHKAGRIAGRLMGEFICDQGDVAIVSSRKQDELSLSLSNREQSFIDMVNSTYPGITLLEPIVCYDNPEIVLREVLNILKNNNSLKGIYVTGGSVKEVGKAVKQAGIGGELKIICFERYPEIIELMQEGVVTCTLANDLHNQGFLPVKMLVDSLVYGISPAQRHVFTNVDVMVKESVED